MFIRNGELLRNVHYLLVTMKYEVSNNSRIDPPELKVHCLLHLESGAHFF